MSLQPIQGQQPLPQQARDPHPPSLQRRIKASSTPPAQTTTAGPTRQALPSRGPSRRCLPRSMPMRRQASPRADFTLWGSTEDRRRLIRGGRVTSLRHAVQPKQNWKTHIPKPGCGSFPWPNPASLRFVLAVCHGFRLEHFSNCYRPKMNCHSERSEESPHFARCATVYTLSKML